MIAIIDYDAGNIKSVEKAFQYIGEDTVVSRDKDVILSADKVVLPGVGSFGDAMEKLRDYDLTNNGRLFKGIEEQSYVYFVHSYYLEAEDEQIVKASTDYVTHIHASVESGNVFACQFHPEKSGDVGLQILKNFAAL